MKIELRDEIYVELKKGNLRGFTLYTNSEDILLKRNAVNYSIEAVIIEDKYTLKLEDMLTIEDVTYKVNKIRKGNDNFYYCIQERATKTSQFIMPILGYSYEYFDFKNSFYNSYIDSNYQYIYLVYKFNISDIYLQLEDRLQKHSNFVEMYDPDSSTVVFKFKLDEKYWKDIKLIMKGKYSSISPTLKSKICIFHAFGVDSKTYKVLYRVNKLREEMSEEYGFKIDAKYELMSKPVLTDEIWNLNTCLQRIGMKSLNTT